jgi:hypothetical protein
MKRITNVSASVRQRLLNKARSDRRPFNELLQYYAMERFLFRLSRSPHAGRFILKGAMMLRVWCAPDQRPTMDIDLLGMTGNQEAEIIAQVHDILGVSVAADGLAFDPDSVRTEQITADAEYEGVRVRFAGSLGTARISMQLDIGFGDVVYPGPIEAELPTILGDPSPRLLCYSMESAIAEKLEAMVKLGALNSRIKDFYDIWMLSRQFEFNGSELSEAISRTFEQRGSEVTRDIAAFSKPFTDARQVQWEAFRNRLQLEQVPATFQQVVAAVEAFLGPVLEGLESGTDGPDTWDASGKWE